MDDRPEWEQAKEGCYYKAWSRNRGTKEVDLEDGSGFYLTQLVDYEPRVDDVAPGPQEKLAFKGHSCGNLWLDAVADAMGDWTYDPSCPQCGQPAWDRERKLCHNCGATERDFAGEPLPTEIKGKVKENKCTCGQATSKDGGKHSDWCDLV